MDHNYFISNLYNKWNQLGDNISEWRKSDRTRKFATNFVCNGSGRVQIIGLVCGAEEKGAQMEVWTPG